MYLFTASFPQPLQFLLGCLLAVVIALIAFRLKTLNRSGVWAAVILGTVVFSLGGLAHALLLIAFFITSSGLSRLFRRRKEAVDEKFSKGSSRDAYQVLANGGAAGLLVLLQLALPDAAWVWPVFAASLAAANADTWATELGVLNPTPPRLITSLKPVARGTSGGISLGGTLAALAGSGLIGLLAVILRPGQQPLLTLGIISLSGLIGSFVDSLLGATLQAIYYCPACQKETERHPLHLCGSPTRLVRGLKWLNNDWVNACCTISAAAAAAALTALL